MRSGGDDPRLQDDDRWGAGGSSAEPAQPDYSEYTATLNAEREWRRVNRELWENEVEAYAVNEAAHGRKFSTSAIIQRIRWKDRVDENGKDVQVNDHFSAPWSRLLVKMHPELEPFVIQRRTPWDYVKELEVEP